MNVQDAHAAARAPTTPPDRLRHLLADPALALDLAANPAAPPDVLLALAKNSDPAVRTMLAGNPNISLEIVKHIGAIAPDRLFANPALPLWVLERPSFFSELPTALVLGLLRYAAIPAAYLALIARYPDEEVQRTACLHVQRCGDWPADVWEERAREATQHTRLGHRMLFEWQSLFPVAGVIQPWLLAWLADHDDIQVRQAVATCPDAPVESLTSLACDPAAEVRRVVAQHPALPHQALATLAHDKDTLVRITVARHPHTSPAILSDLASDAEWAVRLEVSRHPQTPHAPLCRLLNDSEEEVRQAAAETLGMSPAEVAKQLVGTPLGHRLAAALDPATSEFELRYLARRTETDVRAAVALNAAAPRDLLLQLACDPSEVVREAVMQGGRLPLKSSIQTLIERSDIYGHCYLAAHPQSPPSLLRKICKDDAPGMWIYLACNPATPYDVLSRLFFRKGSQSDTALKVALAKHPNTPTLLLPVLACDAHADVRQTVAENPHFASDDPYVPEYRRHNEWWHDTVARRSTTPPVILAQMLPEANAATCQTIMQHPLAHGVLRQRAALKLVQDMLATRWSLCRVAVLTYPHLPGAVLAQHAMSEYWLVRLVVARHPNTPPEVVAALAQDGSAPVRAAAQARQHAQ